MTGSLKLSPCNTGSASSATIWHVEQDMGICSGCGSPGGQLRWYMSGPVTVGGWRPVIVSLLSAGVSIMAGGVTMLGLECDGHNHSFTASSLTMLSLPACSAGRCCSTGGLQVYNLVRSVAWMAALPPASIPLRTLHINHSTHMRHCNLVLYIYTVGISCVIVLYTIDLPYVSMFTVHSQDTAAVPTHSRLKKRDGCRPHPHCTHVTMAEVKCHP